MTVMKRAPIERSKKKIDFKNDYSVRCYSVDKDLVILNPLYHQEILRFHALMGE